MQTNAKFKHTNLLKRKRYRAALKAVDFYGKIKFPAAIVNGFVIYCSPTPEYINATSKVVERMRKLDRYLGGNKE